MSSDGRNSANHRGPGARIRDANLQDVERIAEIHVQSWRETYRGLMAVSVLDGLSVEARAEMWRNALCGGYGKIEVIVAASQEDRILGFASAGSCRNSELGADAEVYAIYIGKEEQGYGIGRWLMQELASRLVMQGFCSLGLWVLRDNVSGRGFYDRMGGRPIVERDDTFEGQQLVEVGYRWDDIAVELLA